MAVLRQLSAITSKAFGYDHEAKVISFYIDDGIRIERNEICFLAFLYIPESFGTQIVAAPANRRVSPFREKRASGKLGTDARCEIMECFQRSGMTWNGILFC